MTVLLKKLWRTRRRETLLGGVVLLLIAVALPVNLPSIGKKVSRLSGGANHSRAELLRLQEECKAAAEEESRLLAPVRRLATARGSFWEPKPNLQLELRRRLEQCARSSGLKVKSIGTLQNVKLLEGLLAMELQMTADAQIGEVTAFLRKIEQEQPRIFWKNLSLTPDNLRSPGFLTLNGTLQVIVLDEPDVARKLWGE